MNTKLKQSILQTIVYADIFDYPLTLEEIWLFLIIDKKVSKKTIQQVLKELPYRIFYKRGYYFLINRGFIVDRRIKLERYSVQKNIIAHKICSYISCVPTILFIGISGGLAVQNVDKDDDIDFFIITRKNTVWITRLLIAILLEAFGVRRKRFEKRVSDKVCVNMLIDESMLAFSKEKQNLYTAHEIVQIKPLFQRNNIYRKFIYANKWVREFLPNSLAGIRNQESGIRNQQQELSFIIHYSLLFSEWFAKKIQLWYMKNNITKETVSDHLLAFHPFDYQKHVLYMYKKRLKNYV